MKVQVEKKPESVSTLKIELPAEEVSKEWDTIANSFARFAKIPCYRPGKAPRAVIDKRFPQENSGRSYEEARFQELSRGDRTKEIAGRVADELGRSPLRRR